MNQKQVNDSAARASASSPTALQISWLIAGISVGACLAYFLDPDRGRRRRALVRDKAVHLNKVTTRLMDQKRHHLQNKMQGYWSRINLRKSFTGWSEQKEIIH